MGLIEDRHTTTVDGHEIAVVARTGPIAGRFGLYVDGELQDDTKGVRGKHWLEGRLPGVDGRAFRVRIVIKAIGMAGEEYWLEIDGTERKIGEGWIF